MKKLSKVLNESIWGKVLDRGAGETVRKEDEITTNEELKNRIQKLYEEQGEGDTLDVSSLTNFIKCDDFSYLFSGYEKVKHIIGLEDWDVSNVKNMECMFYDCKKFNSDLSKWNVSSVGDMNELFEGCEKFNSDLSNWDVRSVRYMTAMFCGCKNFKSDLSKWDVSNVKNMNCMFMGCEKFNSDLSKWNVSNVKNMNFMFDGCDSLKNKPSWYINR